MDDKKQNVANGENSVSQPVDDRMISENLQPSSENIEKAGKVTVDVAKGAGKASYEAAKGAGKATYEATKGAAKATYEAGKGIAKGSVEFGKSVGEGIAQGAETGAAAGGVGAIPGAVIGAAKGALVGLGKGSVEVAKGTGKATTEAAKGAKNATTEVARGAKRATSELARGAKNVASDISGTEARKAENAIYKAAKGVGKAIKAGVKYIATHPQTWGIVNTILIATAIFVLAFVLILIIISDWKNLLTFDFLDGGMTEIFSDWGDNLTDLQEDAKKTYETTGSLLDVDIETINSLVKKLEKKNEELEESEDTILEKYVFSALLNKYGGNTFDDTKRIVDPNDKVSAYEHMLLTSKYDFNKVKWKHYGHGFNGEDSPMKDELELGVKIPDDQNQTKYSTFSSLLRPYLMSYEIPMSFFTGYITEDRDVEEKQMAEKGSQIAYAISKYGLSDITVNRYDNHKYDLATYYRIYDYVDCNSTFSISFDYNKDVKAYIINWSNVEQHELGTGHVNTRQNEEGNEDVMLETLIPEETKLTIINQYYISVAKIFDAVIKNEYTYVPYSESDAENRINPKYENVSKSLYQETADAQNKVESPVLPVGSCQKSEIEDVVKQIVSANNASGYSGGGTKYVISGSNYQERNGDQYNVYRTWEDDFSVGSHTEELYKVSDVIEYNENCEAGRVSEADFKADSESVEYYENLEKEKRINRIDLLNSNPGIFVNYLIDNVPDYKYVGVHWRTFQTFCYETLKKNWRNFSKKYKTFPYVYGKTLGFGRSSNGGSDSNSYLSGMSLLKEYIRAWEGVGEQPVVERDGVKYYTAYLDSAGLLTVGYGVNLVAHPADKQMLESIINQTIVKGVQVPVEEVDKIEDRLIQGCYDEVKAATSGLDLKEYQLHALTSFHYNGLSVSKVASLYVDPAYWNEETDDKYEEVYEKYKDDKENVSAITNEADLSRGMYKDFFALYTHAKNSRTGAMEELPGLVLRRKSEYILFQLGYYDKLKRFWGGGEGTPEGISLLNGGTIDESGCVALQTWFEANLFSNKVHCNTNIYDGDQIRMTPEGHENTDFWGYLNPEYSYIYRSSYIYQCPWWSYVRGTLYYHLVGRADLAERLHGAGQTGHGKDAASFAADYLGISNKLNDRVENIQPYSIISFSTGTEYGHTAFVEAVTDNAIVISDCGSGFRWYGVHVISRDRLSQGGTYHFKNSICLADAL